MGIIKKGNYLFVTYVGDHDPRHVHVFKDGKEVLKWNLEKDEVMNGKITKKLRKIIDELRKEGRL